jgi:beta-glucosidase
VDAQVAAKYANIVDSPGRADFALLRLTAPYQVPQGSQNFLEQMFHQGDLDFKGEELEHILEVCRETPTIIDIYLDRPAVIPEIKEEAAAVIANFGAEDDAILDIIFGKFNPSGSLPFDMPSSMEAVLNQYEDVPFDTENPLFNFGHGLSYGILENLDQ